MEIAIKVDTIKCCRCGVEAPSSMPTALRRVGGKALGGNYVVDTAGYIWMVQGEQPPAGWAKLPDGSGRDACPTCLVQVNDAVAAATRAIMSGDALVPASEVSVPLGHQFGSSKATLAPTPTMIHSKPGPAPIPSRPSLVAGVKLTQPAPIVRPSDAARPIPTLPASTQAKLAPDPPATVPARVTSAPTRAPIVHDKLVIPSFAGGAPETAE
jgi:hypothetical protein